MSEQHLRCDGSNEIAEICRHIDEEIVDGQHAHDLRPPHHNQAPHCVRAEHAKGVVQVGVGLNRQDGRRHDTVDAGVQGQTASYCTADEVTIGDDADKVIAVEHNERADTGLVHQGRRFPDRLVGTQPDH